MRAASGTFDDRLLAVDAGCRFLGLLVLVPKGFHLVECLDDQEHHEGYNEELDDRADEITIGYGRFACADREHYLHVGEVDAADKGGYQGHDKIIDDRIHDGSECCADHNGYRQIHDVAAVDKIFELFQKGFHDLPRSF